MVAHHVLSYFGIMMTTLGLLIILFFLYLLISVFSLSLASFFIGILGIILYFYFLLHFFDIYLDAVIVTENTIIIFQWYDLFKTTTDVIALHAIESVYADQKGLIDTLFNKGDIVFRRAGHENVFDSVYNPVEIANKINAIINSLHKEEEVEKDEEEEVQDDFKIFVEAMAEVIKEYK